MNKKSQVDQGFVPYAFLAFSFAVNSLPVTYTAHLLDATIFD